MKIGYDASRAFVPEATGTENYSLNLLKALAKVDRKNQYRVYLRVGASFMVNGSSGKTSKKIPMNDKRLTINFNWPSNFEFKVIRPSRLWTQIGLALETWRNPVDLLFVPAHTLPILRRRRLIVNSSWLMGKIQKTEGKSPMNHKPSTINSPKYVVTIHDLGVEYLPGYHQFPQRYYLDLTSRYAARFADAIIAVSAATKRDLVNRYGIDGKKIFVVHEGVDTDFFKPRTKDEVLRVKSKYKIKGDYILFVGTIQPRKNLQMLIEAFSLLVNRSSLMVHRRTVRANPINDKLSTTNLIIAGKLGWDYVDILAAPRKFGVSDRVKFLGHVAGSDLPALYSGASVFAFPSLFEGFGLPILEALACGCGVIASDIAPHREILRKISNVKFQMSSFDFTQDDPEFTEGSNFKFNSKSLEIGNWKLEIPSSRELGVPMILTKVDDPDEWANVLYQYISQSRQNISIKTNLASKFSWIETARNTLEVFSKVLQ